MSARNGSASDADCQISEDCRIPADVELMELGPLLEQAAQPGGAKALAAEVGAPLPPQRPGRDEDEVGEVLTLPCRYHMEKKFIAQKVWEGRWRVIPFHVLPEWLKDNDYLLHGHRPPMPSFQGPPLRSQPSTIVLDAAIVASFNGTASTPRHPIHQSSWYIHTHTHTPRHRATRAGVFMGLGLSGIVPTMHFTIEEGFVKATTVGQMGWFYLMGAMYITGAGLYAARIPERYFPGKCDILFHSHQIFHVLVVAAAFIHFYGVSNLQEFRYGLEGGCTDDTLL
ncbi:adiponectin receptor protein 1a [Alosa alosa]|uniref:adiponectin receptor protein 1a n=1 Tax=Alosa alosa TaxID=278164 RepID=UPI0020152654|nr:adiponectin receptor protein 1a [Alosa alosa]